jgi:hypothetical protein
VDFGKIKLKELEGDPYITENGKRLTVFGMYQTGDKEISLNPFLCFLPEMDKMKVGAHELTHQSQHIKGKMEKLSRKYGEWRAHYELESEAYRTPQEILPALYSEEDFGNLIRVPRSALARA